MHSSQLKREVAALITPLLHPPNSNKGDKHHKGSGGNETGLSWMQQGVVGVFGKELEEMVWGNLVEKREFLETIEAKDRKINNLQSALFEFQEKIRYFQQKYIFHLPENNPDKNQQLTFKCEEEQRRRKKAEKQLKWSQNKLKQQLKQIQLLKQAISSRQLFIQQITNHKNTSKQSQNYQFSTPRSIQPNNLDNFPAISCQSVQSSKPLQESLVVERMSDICDRERGSISTKNSHSQTANQFPAVVQKLLHQSEQDSGRMYRHSDWDKKGVSSLNQTAILHRHSDTDKKDKIIRNLGQKCIMLESHIEDLTKQLLMTQIPLKMSYETPSKLMEGLQSTRNEGQSAVKQFSNSNRREKTIL